MMPSLLRKQILAWAISGSASVLLAAPAFCQLTFHGAPPPSDYGDNIGDNLGGDVITPEAEGVADAGLGLYSKIPFKMNFAVREGYDSNVFTTRTDPISSFYTNFASGLNYNFGSSRLKLSSSLGGGVTYYYTRPGEKIDWTGNFALSATYLATPRLAFAIATNTAYLSQPDLTIVGGTNRQDGDYMYSNTSLTATYQWTEIISSVTGYNFTVFYYMDEGLNDSQGRISQTVSQSINWLWKPKTTLLGEYRINPTTYFEADLDQLSNFFLVGFDQIFNPKAFWNFRFGAQVNFNNNQTDGSSIYVGPYMESTFRYQFGPASSLAWNMRYGTEASGLNDVTQRQTFRTGITLAHSLSPRLTANLGFNYQCNYYDQANVISSFIENIIDVSLGVTFKINRNVSLQAGYQFIIDIAPQQIEREYNRNVAFVGANFAF